MEAWGRHAQDKLLRLAFEDDANATEGIPVKHLKDGVYEVHSRQESKPLRSADLGSYYWLRSATLVSEGEGESRVAWSRDLIMEVARRSGWSVRFVRFTYVPLSEHPGVGDPRDVVAEGLPKAVSYRLWRNARKKWDSPDPTWLARHAVGLSMSFPRLLVLKRTPPSSRPASGAVVQTDLLDRIRAFRVHDPLSRESRNVGFDLVDWYATLVDPERTRLHEELGAYARTLDSGEYEQFETFLHQHDLDVVRVQLAALATS